MRCRSLAMPSLPPLKTAVERASIPAFKAALVAAGRWLVWCTGRRGCDRRKAIPARESMP